MTDPHPDSRPPVGEELEELLVERACANLSRRYALYADRYHASRIADLFTPEGVFAAPGMSITGREQIRETFRRREELARLRTVHQLTGLHITRAGSDTAIGWVTLCLYRRVAVDTELPATNTSPVLLGHYEDTYTRSGNDGWLIASRRQHVSFRDPADPGWNVDKVQDV